MGFLSDSTGPEARRDPTETSSEPEDVGGLDNVRLTSATVVEFRDGDVFYGQEAPCEFGEWPRFLPQSVAGREMAFHRLECRTVAGTVEAGHAFIVADAPRAGRRRYDRSTFRRGYSDIKRVFGSKFDKAVDRIRDDADRSDRVRALIEDPELVKWDPFTAGGKVMVAGLGAPNRPFPEPDFDWTPRIEAPSQPKTAQREPGNANVSAADDHDEAGGPASRTGWFLGVCSNANDAFLLVHSKLSRIAERAHDRRYTVARGGRELRIDLAAPAALQAAEHASWLAMAGIEAADDLRDQPVSKMARRLFNALMFNLERKRLGRR